MQLGLAGIQLSKIKNKERLWVWWILGIIVGLIFILAFNNKYKLTQTAQTYYNPNREIKFQYLTAWKVDERVVDGPNPIIGKIDRGADTSIILLHSGNSKKLTFDEYTKSSIEELKFAPGYSLISQEFKTVNEIKTYQLTANYENGIRSRSIYFISPDNERLFTLVYRSTESKFDQYLTEFEDILKTIEVK